MTADPVLSSLPSPRAPIAWRAKSAAFSVHALSSVVVFAVVIVAAVTRWYPPPFFWIDGGLQITLLAAFVDIVLGPALTFVVYRPRWPGMRRLLAGIAAVQLAALGWGVHILYQQRPVLAAYVGHVQNRFFPVTVEQVRSGPRPLGELQALSAARPPMVYIELPADPALQDAHLRALMARGESILRETARFRAIDTEAWQRIIARSRTRETYQRLDAHFVRAIDRFVAEHGGRADAFAFVPLYGRFGRALLAFSRSDATYLGVVVKEFRWR